MELSDRKKQILQAIIDEYMGTAEPVGSRAISKRDGLGLSSATIRNEMADLEEMGFLVQPHTSAGRVPSDMGYRFYVNSLMKRYQMSVEAIERMRMELEQKVNRLEILIKKASMITSLLTDYTTVISTPELNGAEIMKFELVNLGNGVVMIVIITKAGVLKNKVVHMGIDEKTTHALSVILNKSLSGLTARDITFEKIQDMQMEIGANMDLAPKILVNILSFVYEAIEALDETEVYVENAKSILRYPEYSNLEKAQKMLTFLEDEKNLKTLIASGKDQNGVNIKIGAENQFEELADCSLVTVDYSVGGKPVGTLGVIGPKRMNYAKVIASLDCISKHIDRILYQLYIGESEG